jgi:hypothetical protein
MADYDYKVVNEDLLNEATVWEEQAVPMRAAASAISGMTLEGADGGLFFMVIDGYNSSTNYIQGLVSAGATEFDSIGTALRANAAAYKQAEADVEADYVRVDGGY